MTHIFRPLLQAPQRKISRKMERLNHEGFWVEMIFLFDARVMATDIGFGWNSFG